MPPNRANAKAWTHEEHLLAMNLYCKLPFGKLHKGNPEIIVLAELLGRTPSSVSMKLTNFASLDPQLQARGIRGLSGCSKDAQDVWDEFHRNWNELADKSEGLLEEISPRNTSKRIAREIDWESQPMGPSEASQLVRVRRTQRFFRMMILASYENKCCVTGIPIPELLIASHIIPWSVSPEHRTNPRNGLCLSRLYDAAFDAGLITFDEDSRLILSQSIKDSYSCNAINAHFAPYEGKPITIPIKFAPDPAFIAHHRENCFVG